jgi:hypothetical protein
MSPRESEKGEESIAKDSHDCFALQTEKTAARLLNQEQL